MARHDSALIEQLRLWGGMVLASDGVHPAKSHETLDMLRDVRSGRVFVAKTWLSSATPGIALVIEAVLS